MSKHTVRTLKELRKDGYTCGMVERFLQYAGKFGRRVDLFGIIDIIAIKHGEIKGIQSCGANFAEHDRLLSNNENTKKWLDANGKLELWSWRKVKKSKTDKRKVFKPRIKIYKLSDEEE